jgi:hypothetical protein
MKVQLSGRIHLKMRQVANPGRVFGEISVGKIIVELAVPG